MLLSFQNYKQNEEDLLEILDDLFKEKLEIKRELVIVNIEVREAARKVTKGGDLPVAVSFLQKQDKESVLKRLEILEKAGVKVMDAFLVSLMIRTEFLGY